VGRRREIAGLIAATGARQHGAVVAVIDGPPGVGKSALSLEAAWILTETGRFPDGQIYVNLHGSTPGVTPLEPLAAVSRILRGLGMDSREVPTDLEEATARLRSLTAERRMLFLLDNAHDADQVRSLLPAGIGCAVIVTSRTALGFMPGSTALTLDTLDHADGLRLFERLVGRQRMEAEPQAYERLLAHCGWLPLAIQIAGRRLASRSKWTAEYYAELISDDRHRLDGLRFGDREIRNTLSLSYAAAAEENRAGARAFRLLALLDIPDIAVEVAAAVLGASPTEAGDIADYLADANLVHWTRSGHVAYHDLLKLIAREQAHREDDAETRRAAVGGALRSYVAGVVAAVRTFRPGASRVAVAIDPSWPASRRFDDPASAQVWLGTEWHNIVALVVQAAAIDTEVGLAATLCSALFPFMDMHALWAESLPALHAVVDGGRRTGRRDAEAETLSDVGWALLRLGHNRDAERYLRAGIEIAVEIGDRRGEASCLNVMGVLHKSTGRNDQAIDYYLRCLALRRELEARSEVASTLTNLGNLYSCLRRHEDAIACHEQYLSISRALGDDRAVAVGLVNLGDNLVDVGRLEEGSAVLEQAIRLSDVTQETALRAMAITFLARARRWQGDYPEAESLAQSALTLYTDVNFPRGRAEALRELGGAMAGLGQPGNARTFLEQSLRLYSELDAPEAGRVAQELTAITQAL
jgi:tetratricopeptide (TPR) repeat protein